QLLPASVRGASDVHRVSAGGARAPPPHLPRPGPVVPLAARVRDPPPRASRVLGYGAGSALARVLFQRADDDAPHQAPVRRLRLPPRGARAPLPGWIPRVATHRRPASGLLVGADWLGRSVLRAILPLRHPLVVVGAASAAVGDGPDPRGDRQLGR